MWTGQHTLQNKHDRNKNCQDTESGQVPLSDPLSGVLRPKFGLRPNLSQNLTWRQRFGLRIFLDRIWRPDLSQETC